MFSDRPIQPHSPPPVSRSSLLWELKLGPAACQAESLPLNPTPLVPPCPTDFCPLRFGGDWLLELCLETRFHLKEAKQKGQMRRRLGSMETLTCAERLGEARDPKRRLKAILR